VPALWSLTCEEEPVDLHISSTGRDLSANDLGLVISISDDARPAFDRSSPALPPLRAVLDARLKNFSHDLNPGQVSAIVRKIVRELREARALYRTDGTLHIVLAGPVGLAVLLGQWLNTFKAIATYEFCLGEDPPYQIATILREP
jgi:hypothetical protein